MHLNVADLDRSQAFYEWLGMQVMADLGGFMRFIDQTGTTLTDPDGIMVVPQGERVGAGVEGRL
jgi:catechol 2,3-dioxygenase-like lactoylglutathione lyase family enzyme